MKGIKCHSGDCTFTDNNAELKDWVNKPCPVCNEIIINDSDYNALLELEKVTNIIPGFKEMQEKLLNNTSNIDGVSFDNILSDMFGNDMINNMFGNMFTNINDIKVEEEISDDEVKEETKPQEVKRKKTRRSKKS